VPRCQAKISRYPFKGVQINLQIAAQQQKQATKPDSIAESSTWHQIEGKNDAADRKRRGQDSPAQGASGMGCPAGMKKPAKPVGMRVAEG
jgi:hypothetical protein